MKTFFCADTHIGHHRIIELCKRPFASIDEMNETMAHRWNNVVGANDDVWLLGDFCWKGYEYWFYQLNGNKHLIIGNHDGRHVLTLPWASQPRDRRELSISAGDGKAHRLVLDHYPIEEWNRFHKGTLHLHGHVHGRTLNAVPRRVDVGVDLWNFTPITLDQILAHVAAQT